MDPLGGESVVTIASVSVCVRSTISLSEVNSVSRIICSSVLHPTGHVQCRLVSMSTGRP